ncbi:MAG: hypothetical protein AXW14_01030 [Alteromonas sp. Nap_26]|nr:MAG: hypothetical protein AXW14_01030 [Alteromonas sp. Nap_26]
MAFLRIVAKLLIFRWDYCEMNSKKAVIFDHDGGIDDLLSLLLLLRLPNIEVIGVSITPADCYPDDALISTKKILTLSGNTHIPVCVGNITGPNPFPPEWRAQPKICHAMPLMLRTPNDDVTVVNECAHQWMRHVIASHPSNVTVIMTGPATNLVAAINCPEKGAQVKNNIDRVIWMGGAVDVKGNVAMHDHNGTAEWNAYWHPKATHQLVHSGLDVMLVPLDATNSLPVSWEFLNALAEKQTAVSDLAGQFWAATVTAIPSYEFTYFLWDVLSVCAIALPQDKFTTNTGKITVATSTPNAGQTYRDDTLGADITWMSWVDAEYVRQMVIHYLSGDFKTLPVTYVN